VSLIVSNASPLINLARIRRFDLLQQFYRYLTIPTAVYDEVVVRGQERDGSRDVRNAAWISRATPTDDLAVAALTAQLDLGEASAIILARELNAELLLILGLDLRRCDGQHLL
jgi:predicted nucleic acid-binding protein